MKNGLLIAILVVVLAAGGVFAYMALNGSGNENANTADTMMEEDAMMEDEDLKLYGENAETPEDVNAAENANAAASSLAPAQYVEYSSVALASAQAAEGGDTVLYFHANWCPVCRVLDPDIVANIGSLPDGLTILKVNYDTETALKAKYGVTYQHTFVQVDASGNKLKLWSGGTEAADIADQVI